MLEKLREETDYSATTKVVAWVIIIAVTLLSQLLCFNFGTDGFIWLISGIIAIALAMCNMQWSNLREVLITGVGTFFIVTLLFEIYYVLIEISV